MTTDYKGTVIITILEPKTPVVNDREADDTAQKQAEDLNLAMGTNQVSDSFANVPIDVDIKEGLKDDDGNDGDADDVEQNMEENMQDDTAEQAQFFVHSENDDCEEKFFEVHEQFQNSSQHDEEACCGDEEKTEGPANNNIATLANETQLGSSRYPKFLVYSGNSYGYCNGVYYKTTMTSAGNPVYRRGDGVDRWIWQTKSGLYILGERRGLGKFGGFASSRNLTGSWNVGRMKGYNDAELVAVIPDNGKAKANNAHHHPKRLTTQILRNDTSATQSMRMIFSYEKSKTKSWSHKVDFSFKMSASVKVGFRWARFSTEMSLSSKYSFHKTESTAESVVERYELPMEVPPRRMFTGTFILREYRVDIPYSLLFNVGGHSCKVPGGIWKGCMYGDVTYDIKERRI